MRKMTILVMAGFMAGAALAGCGDDTSATEAPATTAAATTEAPATTAAATTTAAPTTTATTAAPAETEPPETAAPGPMAISSPAFEDGGNIPIEFSCDGDNLSPELTFSGAPAGTTSLALTVIDPDGGDWVHWIVWNIPVDSSGIPEGARAGATLPDGSMQALNDFAPVFDFGDLFPSGAPVKITGWDGPCPGPEPHRYVFTLYALTGTIDLPGASEPGDILAAIEDARENGSLVGEASIVGMYPAG